VSAIEVARGGLPSIEKAIRLHTPGVVYVIQSGDRDLFKIGFTSDTPRARLEELQTGNPDTLHLCAWGHGTRHDEQALHLWFEDDRVRGEWFRGSDGVHRLIARLNRDIWRGVFARIDDVLRELLAEARR
jgi:hypothetical protein